MRDFKRGDIVRCVAALPNFLTFGKLYAVVGGEANPVVITDTGVDGVYAAERFVPVQEYSLPPNPESSKKDAGSTELLAQAINRLAAAIERSNVLVVSGAMGKAGAGGGCPGGAGGGGGAALGNSLNAM